MTAACEEPSQFRFLYPDDLPLRQRVERIACQVYGADGVDWSPLALEKAARFESDPRYADYCTMMVKTHLSLSHDPALKGVPQGWRLPVRDVLEYSGARFLCPVAGAISMMPGTGSDPAYRRAASLKGEAFFWDEKFFFKRAQPSRKFCVWKEKYSGGRGAAHNILWRMLRLPRNMGRNGLKCLVKQTFS